MIFKNREDAGRPLTQHLGAFSLNAHLDDSGTETERDVSINTGSVTLEGTLSIPREPKGMVIFVHGSGSSRHSPRNKYVAEVLNKRGLATLLFDLLTRDEEAFDRQSATLRFNILLLAKRLIDVTQWLTHNEETRHLAIGYFGASTGAGAALVAAARLPGLVAAIVSRGGRPDLAAEALSDVVAPTLLVDDLVVTLNRKALEQLKCKNKQLIIIPGATHLFEEPGTLEQVAHVSAEWFFYYFAQAAKEKHQEVSIATKAGNA
jgi:putative phosphoribosyl transferase